MTAALNAMFLKLRPTDAPGALRISGWEMLIYRSGPEAQNDRVREVQGGCYQRGKAEARQTAFAWPTLVLDTLKNLKDGEISH